MINLNTIELLLREIAIQLRIANTLKNKTGYYQDRAEAAREIDNMLKYNTNSSERG